MLLFFLRNIKTTSSFKSSLKFPGIHQTVIMGQRGHRSKSANVEDFESFDLATPLTCLCFASIDHVPYSGQRNISCVCGELHSCMKVDGECEAVHQPCGGVFRSGLNTVRVRSISQSNILGCVCVAEHVSKRSTACCGIS